MSNKYKIIENRRKTAIKPMKKIVQVYPLLLQKMTSIKDRGLEISVFFEYVNYFSSILCITIIYFIQNINRLIDLKSLKY
jgi:hypothetical protein